MKQAAVNPYLPFWETVPDGEPHVFGDRIYIYGSHDRLNGTSFCEDDYVCWSAPVCDLGNWRCEGTIYKKEQDPINGAPYSKEMPRYEPSFTGESIRFLYAPDVARGPDGRYYLFYALDTVNVISVAVCDTPAGTYEFLDYVRREDGSIPETGRWFDPAVLCEESGNYLYYGFCPPMRFPGMEDADYPGAMMVKLKNDMHTILSEPVCVANGIDTASGTSYEEHPFFEASSIRKIGDWYYFVYSSLQGHELCYGMAKSPEGPFEYKGVIISNGDLGYQGNTLPVNYTGNNHGGLAEINPETQMESGGSAANSGSMYTQRAHRDSCPAGGPAVNCGSMYIFWHRHTHGTAFSRQGCADRVQILPDGTIPQIEITSCGLNGGALPAKASYSTYIACHLTEADRRKVGQVVMSMPGQSLPPFPEEMPYITEEHDSAADHGLLPYIHNMRSGAVAGFKYFKFEGDEKRICLTLRGSGVMEILQDSPQGRKIAETRTGEKEGTTSWSEISCDMDRVQGEHALYFRVREGKLDFAEFCIQQ